LTFIFPENQIYTKHFFISHCLTLIPIVLSVSVVICRLQAQTIVRSTLTRRLSVKTTLGKFQMVLTV